MLTSDPSRFGPERAVSGIDGTNESPGSCNGRSKPDMPVGGQLMQGFSLLRTSEGK